MHTRLLLCPPDKCDKRACGFIIDCLGLTETCPSCLNPDYPSPMTPHNYE